MSIGQSHQDANLRSPSTVRVAVVIPVWRQARYLAGAVASALDQETVGGVGIVVVNDGCPEPETDRIGQALRDAEPGRVAYVRQSNAGVSAARNVGIELALRRWPQVEAVFPLDADNRLSPHTLATLRERLEENPEAGWASPALEFFGAEEGGWQVPGPYLPYRQLLMNQCDTGSLIRREIFDSGFWYDETIRYGFEDWELFLRASLAGTDGFLAGPCGFRYRRRRESMLQEAQQRAELLEAEIRGRHAEAYEPGALTRREHAEAPRFAVILCDRNQVLLTAACDLKPRVVSLADYARAVAAAADGRHTPAITVFTSSAALDRLGEAGLATALFGLQSRLRDVQMAGLRFADGSPPDLAAIGVRAKGLRHLEGGVFPLPSVAVEVEAGRGDRVDPLPEAGTAAARLLGIASREAGRLPVESHTAYLEYRHLEQAQTTFPWSSGEPLSAAGARA